MSVTSRVSGSEMVIAVNGCFDVSCYEAFNHSYQGHLALDEPAFVIDLAHTTYLDSSALGMLLLLRERAGGEGSQIRIVNVGSAIEEVLKMAHFDQIFDIEYQE